MIVGSGVQVHGSREWPVPDHPMAFGAPGAVSPPRLVRLREVLERTGLKRSDLYARIRRGDFPPQIPLGSPRSA